MRKALWVAIGVLSVATIAIAIAIDRWTGAPNAGFVTATVATGDMVRAIIATGGVNPVVTVQVGTYVSGVIQKIACDFNTKVEAGQLCAKIDPRTFQEEVDQAKANLGTPRRRSTKTRRASRRASTTSATRDCARAGRVQDTLDSDQSGYDQAVAQVELRRGDDRPAPRGARGGAGRTSTTPTSSRRSTARWCRATSTSARRSRRASRRRPCS